MDNLLKTIRDELKDVHIEDGTSKQFDRVCQGLANKITESAIYEMGVRNGVERTKDEIRDFLGIKNCACNSNYL